MRYRTQHMIDSDSIRLMNMDIERFHAINKIELVRNLSNEIIKNIEVDMIDVKEPIPGLKSEIDIYVIDKKQFNNLIERFTRLIHDNDEYSRKKIIQGIMDNIINR